MQDDSNPTVKYYGWDGEGRMNWVSNNSGTGACPSNATSCFVYNALGQRVEMKNGAGTSFNEFAYDAFGNLAALHNRTAFVFRIYYLGGRPIARHQDSKTYFMHPNHLGSTIPQGGMTDQTGATTQKTRYYPFGQLWTSGGTIRDDRFASMDPRDAETGNNPTLFRMQNPRLYRWLSPDPLAGDISNPQSLNRYAYVMNSPVNLTASQGVSSEIPAITFPGPIPGPPPPSPGSTAASSKPITCCGPVRRYQKPIDLTDPANIVAWGGWFVKVERIGDHFEIVQNNDQETREVMPPYGNTFNPPELSGYPVGLTPILDYLNGVSVGDWIEPIRFRNDFHDITRITSPGPGCVYIWAAGGFWAEPYHCPPPQEAIQSGNVPTDPRTYNNPPPGPPPPASSRPLLGGCDIFTSWGGISCGRNK